MGKIIDFRIRPPYGDYLKLGVPYDFQFIEPTITRRVGLEIPQSARNHSMDQMIREMKDAGIDMGVIVGRDSPAWGTVPNDQLHAVAQQYPGLFFVFGGVHPLPTQAAIKEIERCIKDLGFKGIAVEPGSCSPPMVPSDSALYPVYSTCQRLQVPVMMTISLLTGPDVSYSMPLHVDKVAVAFPDLKIIIAHAAYPWVREMLGVAFWRPNVFLLPDLYLPYIIWGNEYVSAANEFLGDRTLFGSAYPISSFASIVAGYKKMPFKPEVLEKVFYGNAARLLGLAESKEGKEKETRGETSRGKVKYYGGS